MMRNVLKAEFMLRGKSIPDVAKDLNLSKKTLYRKLNGESEFTRDEMSRMINYLELDKDKAFNIFLLNMFPLGNLLSRRRLI